jgi:hypothetical protein
VEWRAAVAAKGDEEGERASAEGEWSGNGSGREGGESCWPPLPARSDLSTSSS